MRLFASAVAVLTFAGAVAAQDPKPAEPAQPGGANPFRAAQPKAAAQFGTTTRVTAAKMATLEEEAETLEANRDVRKAFIRAAEVAVKVAEVNAARVEKLVATNAVSKEELEKTRLEIEAAKAQLEIRVAEMKEVEVRVKFAKKRLEDAKAAGVRPLPGVLPGVRPVDPKPIDAPPPPAPPAPDDKAAQLAQLKAKLDKATVEAEKAADASKKAEEESKAAAAQLAKILDIATRGRVLPGTIEKAQAKAKAAKDAAEDAKKKAKAADEEVAAVKAKIKELEK